LARFYFKAISITWFIPIWHIFLNYFTKNGAFFKIKICFKRFYFDLWYSETDQLNKTFIFESYSSKLVINI